MGNFQTGLALDGGGESSEEGSILSGFRALVDMLFSLTNNDGAGRIIISRVKPALSGQQGGYLKYVMLTGQKIFSEVCLKLWTFPCLCCSLIGFLFHNN